MNLIYSLVMFLNFTFSHATQNIFHFDFYFLTFGTPSLVIHLFLRLGFKVQHSYFFRRMTAISEVACILDFFWPSFMISLANLSTAFSSLSHYISVSSLGLLSNPMDFLSHLSFSLSVHKEII